MDLTGILGIIGSLASIMGEGRTQKDIIENKKDSQPLPVDYSDNEKGFEECIEKIDDFLSHKYSGYIISREEREAAKEEFYKINPVMRGDKDRCDNIIENFFRELENYLQVKTSPGERRLSWQIDDLKKMINQLLDLQSSPQVSSNDTLIKIKTGKNIHANSIRRLSDNLWINWKTGVLANDFRSALDDAEGLGWNTATGDVKILTPSQLRLLSILVQAEGGFVSWDEIDARMSLAPTEAEADERQEKKTEHAEGSFVGAERGLKAEVYGSIKDSLADMTEGSKADADGDGKGSLAGADRESKAEIDDDSENEEITVEEELRYYQSVIHRAIRRYQQNKDDYSRWLASRLRYFEWWIENVYDTLTLEGDRKTRAEEFVKIIRLNNYLDSPRFGNRRRVDAMVRQLCGVSGKLAVHIRRDHSKGYCIELDDHGLTDGEKSEASDLYSFYEKYVPEAGIHFTADDWDAITKYSDPSKPEYAMYVHAWQRRYYDGVCESFEKNISNVRDESGYETDDGVGIGNGFETDGEDGDRKESIFGNYKMSRIYLNAYASTKGEVRTEPAPGVVDSSGTVVMLDYLERWFKAGNQSGQVLVLHGQPGDGKTTFCKKAVYAYCKEGWLADSASNVFYFNLNPRNSDILKYGFRLANLLCIENQNSKVRAFITPKDLDGALVILDGFDELSSGWSNRNDGRKFEVFCGEVRKFMESGGLYRFKTVITSRTMCIANELRGKDFKNLKIPVVSFAPMTEPQQDAMIDRMIQLDAEARGTLGDDGMKKLADDAADKKIGLEEYKNVIANIREKKNDREYKYDKLNELLKIPSLFRMIVAQRFDDYEGTGTVAELYKKLFSNLLRNRAGDVTENELVRRYRNIAARIFSHNDDICPCDFYEMKDKNLLYMFLTKNNQQEGRLGFFHRSFYQYFLADFIIAAIKNTRRGESGRSLSPKVKLAIDRGNLDKAPDLIDLMIVLQSRRITDPDMWKLLRQLAVLENEERNIIGRKEGQNKIRRVLEWLEKCDNFSKLLGYEKDKKEKDEEDIEEEDIEEEYREKEEDECDSEKDSYLCAENAVFNLISILAAVEQGCRSSLEKNNHATPYVEYPNICQLLRHGDFSGIYLSELNLMNCNLQNARFQGADLTGTILKRAKIEGANLSHTILKDAVLAHVNPSEIDSTEESDRWYKTKSFFMGANLSGADMRYASLSGSDFSDATLIEAKLQGVHLEEANLSEADLSGTWFSEDEKPVKENDTSYGQAHLERANLCGAVLNGSHMENAVFTDANFRRADLRGAHLDNADLEGACLAETYMDGAYLLGSSLSKADIEGASMVSVVMDRDTKLDSTDMKAAFLVGKSKSGKELFSETNLHAASLKGAKLDGAFISEDQYDSLSISNQTFRDIVDIPKIRFGGKLTVSVEGSKSEEKRQNILSAWWKNSERTIDICQNKGNIKNLVHFGSYPYERDDKSNDRKTWKSLRWRMLRREYDKVLLITEDLIDCKRYHEEYVDITWEKCSLRRWLNEVFILKAFTDEERARIAWVCNQNPDNDYYREEIDGGKPTWDRVFLLSIDEVIHYFSNDTDRKAAPTPYVKEAYKDRVFISDEYKLVDGRGTGWWWLRSPGFNIRSAANVHPDGDVIDYGRGVLSSGASVRPALWLNL